MIAHNLEHREFDRILIIKPSSFGDVIHALPVLHGLRHRYPKARISWLVAHICAGLLENHPALDEIIRFDRKRYGRLGRSLSVSIEFMEFVNDIRARRFDLVIDLQGLFRSGFLAFASGASTRIGFAQAREFAPLFYTHRLSCRDPEMHAVDRNYLVARTLGFEDVPLAFDLPMSVLAQERAQAILAAVGVSPQDSYILMGPGTRWETKIWPAAHFAQLARRIRQELGYRVALIGMESEVDVARNVEQLAGDAVVNLAGKTNLSELIALIERSEAVVMHDSGPMHLAGALGKPMVALYGPTSPQRTGPYRRGESVVRLELPCSPCYLKRLAQCPHNHRCLRELSPDMVFDRLRRNLPSLAEARS